MKIDPACFIFMGDSDIDMKTARAAGMLAVGATWGFRTRMSCWREAPGSYCSTLLTC